MKHLLLICGASDKSVLIFSVPNHPRSSLIHSYTMVISSRSIKANRRVFIELKAVSGWTPQMEAESPIDTVLE